MINKKFRLKIINKYRKKKGYCNTRILFADTECIIYDNEHKPVCFVIVDENYQCTTFYNIQDFMKHLFLECFDSIVYFHNFGRYDSIFILKWIAFSNHKINSIEIIERNNVIYEIKFNKYKVRLRDSYLIINQSLKDISKNFSTFHKKLDFEYNDITNIWSKEPEKIIEQCKQDCKALKDGFTNFSNIIKDKFDIEIYEQLTLPSLSFNIFKKNYYNTFNCITKNPYETDVFIRRSYKGGVSEVYKPFLNNGYCYDANSLYPTIMKNCKFPVGKGHFVKGNEININDFIGFIECRVECNKELNFLTYKDPIKGLISPMGVWTDVYYHKEVIEAIKLGYTFKFIKGFKYEREEYIFENFVDDLYKMRIESKTKSLNLISKLILNSLYGRFGMKSLKEISKFIHERDLRKYICENDLKRIEHIGNNFYFITSDFVKKNSKDLYKGSIDTETAVQIASAITAESRIFMHKFKNLEGNKCYYTDTDSLFLEKELDEKYVGKNLGDFKLEYKFEKAYFIAPKIYYIKKDEKSEKLVMKGIKKDEYEIKNIVKLFEKIIFGGNFEKYEIERTNIFKRSIKKIKIFIEKVKLRFSFPFNKRIKIYKNGVWINTRPFKIKE